MRGVQTSRCSCCFLLLRLQPLRLVYYVYGRCCYSYDYKLVRALVLPVLVLSTSTLRFYCYCCSSSSSWCYSCNYCCYYDDDYDYCYYCNYWCHFCRLRNSPQSSEAPEPNS